MFEHRQKSPLFPRRKNAKRRVAIVVALASFSFSGCGPQRVRVDFTGYERSYAVTSNREVLLNLARLENRDPTYFFKLGQISSSYRMEAGLTGFGQYTPQGATTGVEVPNGGGTPSALYESDPAFSFIPVNDETNARLLLSPVAPEIFYDLYYQGWRVDQLFRLMVERLEITLPNADGKGCRVEIIRNAPPPVFKGNANPIDYDHEQSSIAAYVTFLRVSAVVYALQKYGLLQLRGADQFEPLDEHSFLPADKKGGSGAKAPAHDSGEGASNNHDSGDASGAPTAKEFDETAAKDEYWEMRPVMQGDKQIEAWVLGRMEHQTVFQLTSGSTGQNAKLANHYGAEVEEIENELRNRIFSSDESLAELKEAPELTDILEILYNGFSIEGPTDDQEPQTGFCPTDWSKGAPSRLVLRSLIGLMAAVAQEQDSFEQLEADDPQILLTDAQFQEPVSTLLQQIEKPEAQPPGALTPLEMMTGTIHAGLVALNMLQAQQNGKLPANFDVSKYNEGYAAQAAKYMTDAQENSGRMGTFKGLLPTIERLPVLQLDWSSKNQPNDEEKKNYLPPLATAGDLKEAGFAVHYGNRDFLVTDANLSSIDWAKCENNSAAKDLTCYAKENQFWNRDMFRLINELSSQVTVDISKFPLPNILQLRTE